MPAADQRWWETVLAGPNGLLQEHTSLGQGERYSALPRPSDPRVVVDLDSPRALSDAIDRMVSSRVSNQAIRSAASRLSSVASRRSADWLVNSDGDVGTLREHLSGVLGRPVKLSVAVGPPRPNRKPVVRCYAGDELVAVAKLGPDPHTDRMVRNEAVWLSQLMADPLDGVVTPSVLHSGNFGSSALLVMAPLDLVDDLGVTVAEMPTEVLEAFVRERVEPVSVAQSAWWGALPARLGAEQQAALAPYLEAVTTSSVVDDLEVSAWHGDWSPWNTGATRSGAIAIWDWERASTGVPTGFDLLHLHYQYGSGFDGATLGLAEFGIPTSRHELLAGLYLLELCARHVEADALHTPRHQRVTEKLKATLS